MLDERDAIMLMVRRTLLPEFVLEAGEIVKLGNQSTELVYGKKDVLKRRILGGGCRCY